MAPFVVLVTQSIDDAAAAARAASAITLDHGIVVATDVVAPEDETEAVAALSTEDVEAARTKRRQFENALKQQLDSTDESSIDADSTDRVWRKFNALYAELCRLKATAGDNTPRVPDQWDKPLKRKKRKSKK